jgi:hypothetical protein
MREKWGTLYCLLLILTAKCGPIEQSDMSEFVTDIAFSFVFPIIVFLMGAGWNKTVGVTDPRIGKAFSLLPPVVILAMMTRYHSENIRAVWMMRPIAFSCFVRTPCSAPAGGIDLARSPYLANALNLLRFCYQSHPDSTSRLALNSTPHHRVSPLLKRLSRRFTPKLRDDTH